MRPAAALGAFTVAAALLGASGTRAQPQGAAHPPGALPACADILAGSRAWDDAIPFRAVDWNDTTRARVSGLVVAVDGQPVEGALLGLVKDSVVHAGAIADTAGRFALPPVPPGRYTLRAAVIGMLEQSHALRLLPGMQERLCLIMIGEPVLPPPIGPAGTWGGVPE